MVDFAYMPQDLISDSQKFAIYSIVKTVLQYYDSDFVYRIINPKASNTGTNIQSVANTLEGLYRGYLLRKASKDEHAQALLENTLERIIGLSFYKEAPKSHILQLVKEHVRSLGFVLRYELGCVPQVWRYTNPIQEEELDEIYISDYCDRCISAPNTYRISPEHLELAPNEPVDVETNTEQQKIFTTGNYWVYFDRSLNSYCYNNGTKIKTPKNTNSLYWKAFTAIMEHDKWKKGGEVVLEELEVASGLSRTQLRRILTDRSSSLYTAARLPFTRSDNLQLFEICERGPSTSNLTFRNHP